MNSTHELSEEDLGKIARRVRSNDYGFLVLVTLISIVVWMFSHQRRITELEERVRWFDTKATNGTIYIYQDSTGGYRFSWPGPPKP